VQHVLPLSISPTSGGGRRSSVRPGPQVGSEETGASAAECDNSFTLRLRPAMEPTARTPGGARPGHPEVGSPRSRPLGPPSKPPRSVRRDLDLPGPVGPAGIRPGPTGIRSAQGEEKTWHVPSNAGSRAGGPVRKAKGGVRDSAAESGRGRAGENKSINCLRLVQNHK
jgi:hypothetical protein